MRALLIASVMLYVVLSLGGATAASISTIRIYSLFGRELPEVLSAAIVNTAAVFAATSFIGVLDMFMTLWTLLKSKDWEEEARKERDADRQAREKERQETRQLREAELVAHEKERQETRQLREAELAARAKEFETNHQLRDAELQARVQSMDAERLAREQSLQETRAFQQHILEQLAAERAQRDLVTTRVLDLLEQMSHRLNGNGSNGNH